MLKLRKLLKQQRISNRQRKLAKRQLRQTKKAYFRNRQVKSPKLAKKNLNKKNKKT